MAQTTPSGGIRLFRIAGITVFLHWSWFLIAFWELRDRGLDDLPLPWRIAEYLCLFGIVLLHEFGHAFACRSVGGIAERIVLWPLGGVAYVSPPMRPGPFLWSIVAGPLVNVALTPVLLIGLYLPLDSALAHELAVHLFGINLLLLVFNLLPIYPLDGGKILWCLLWFVLGQGRSLLVASVVGALGAAGLVVLALVSGNNWLFVIAAFSALQCFSGFKQSRSLRLLETAPLHEEIRCPACGASPPAGNFWTCGCGTRFDPFASSFLCPGCGRSIHRIPCTACHVPSPGMAWLGAPNPPLFLVPAADAANSTPSEPPTTMPPIAPSPALPPVAGIPSPFSEQHL